MKEGLFLKRLGANCSSTFRRLPNSQAPGSAVHNARYVPPVALAAGEPQVSSLDWFARRTGVALWVEVQGGGRSCAGSWGWLIASCLILFQILEREGEENEALHKMIANEQKTSLPNLFQDKNRPCLSNWPEVSWFPQRGRIHLTFVRPLPSSWMNSAFRIMRSSLFLTFV